MNSAIVLGISFIILLASTFYVQTNQQEFNANSRHWNGAFDTFSVQYRDNINRPGWCISRQEFGRCVREPEFGYPSYSRGFVSRWPSFWP